MDRRPRRLVVVTYGIATSYTMDVAYRTSEDWDQQGHWLAYVNLSKHLLVIAVAQDSIIRGDVSN